AVAQAAVVALPDQTLGEMVCAVIVASGRRPKLKELKAFLADHGLATYKLPDKLAFLERLPLTAAGKISKRVLIEQLRDSS
ncbi:MAG: AMP-binding enzyme, partial [Pseudonocardiaceae bacterium]